MRNVTTHVLPQSLTCIYSFCIFYTFYTHMCECADGHASWYAPFRAKNFHSKFAAGMCTSTSHGNRCCAPFEHQTRATGIFVY